MSTTPSLIQRLRALDPTARAKALSRLSPLECEAIATDWDLWARDKQRIPPGDWSIWLVMAGRGYGKGLCVHTNIPTPSGWTKIGDLAIGDLVFDEQGKPCRVTATFDYLPRKAYRLGFSDGTMLDACDEHQWVTWTHADRKCLYRRWNCDGEWPEDWVNWRSEYRGKTKGPSIRTTQDIVDTFTHGKRGDLNHCVPLCSPIQCDSLELAVHPYVLGAWLGNGESKGSTIWSFSSELRDIVAKYWPDVSDSRHIVGSSFAFTAYGLLPKLRDLGVFRNKHVPKEYMRSDAKQRLMLLQGLMDSDGAIDEDSSCVEFCSKDKGLAEAVVELARSLGQKPTLSITEAKLYGKSCGSRHRVTWRPTIQVFQISKRANRFVSRGSQFMRNQHRMIVSFEQIEPKPMRCITVDSKNSMYLAGEGFIPTHNTRVGAEFIRRKVAQGARHLILAGRTAADVRDTMLLGPSGLITVSPSWEQPRYKSSERCVQWPNGAKALLLSAEEPDLFRGPQCECFWGDEVAAWQYKESWDNLMFGFRMGRKPQGIVTTTPKRNPLMLELLARDDIHLTTGSTYENRENLAKTFLDKIVTLYEGTRLGRQELHAEILPDAGELWSRADHIDRFRLPSPRSTLRRIVVGIDPAVTSNATSDETGIVVAGIGDDGDYYVLEDCSGRFTPSQWAARALSAYDRWRADSIVAETNNGGDLVEANIRQSTSGQRARYKAVHASRGKVTRAEPIVSLYEQGRVHHCGTFAQLEDQMVGWSPSEDRFSPDRVDALVWALTELAGNAIVAPPSYGGMSVGERSFR